MIEEGFITVEGKSVEVEVFLGGDYKVSRNLDQYHHTKHVKQKSMFNQHLHKLHSNYPYTLFQEKRT